MSTESRSVYEEILSLLRPDSIAVIGASREPHKMGHTIVKNLIVGGFPKEKIFPVNPNAHQILGLKCYPSVKDVPSDVQMAIIAVPAKSVPQVLRECGEKRVKAVAVIAGGFKEAGNAQEEREIVEICKLAGMRLLGPNIVGIADTVKKVNATFVESPPIKGDIGFISQSGALAMVVAEWTRQRDIGLSDLVSIGNRADVNETDLVQFFGDDKHTCVIALYIEGVMDGQRFIRVARNVSKSKPIVALKAGKASRTAAAILSHTGSLAGSEAAYEAAFKQAGVIRAPTISELFEWASALTMLPLPKGEETVILTNGGGAGIMATDAAEAFNVNLMSLSNDLAERVRKFMPPFGSALNPIDLTGMARVEDYEGAVETLLNDEKVKNIIVLYCDTPITHPVEVANAIIRASRSSAVQKPIVTNFIGGEECVTGMRRLVKHRIPAYDTPEEAVAALGQLLYRFRFLNKNDREQVEIKADREKANSVIDPAKREGRRVLMPSEAATVAGAYGIPTPDRMVACNRTAAVMEADKLGYPVVLEVESPDVVHKVDVGGIRMNLTGKSQVREAFEGITRSVSTKVRGADIRGIAVRKMLPQGRELFVGMHRDATFGPLISFGSGGTLIELHKDVSFRVAPLTVGDAKEMMRETKAYDLIQGIRGQEPGDFNAVVEIILRVAKLSEDFPEITDVDINPLFLYGATEKLGPPLAADVKIMIDPRQ
jgi:acetyl coenzyme A synthetase (ADP forming)-like protein